MAAPLILVEARPRRTDTGAAVTVRLAGGGGVKPYRYDGHGWRAGIAGLPRIVAAIDFPGDDLGTGSVPQAMVLRWEPSRAASLAELAAYHWTDADITVRTGPEGTLPPVLLTGKVLEASSSNGELTIALADPAADLKKPLLTDRFAGTGGIEGPAEWEGRIKARAWGRVFNVEGAPIDTANNIYCFGDPARPWSAIGAVRDKGAAAAALTTLAWQGSAAATFAALQAATAPQGGGVACPSIACVKWWTQPAGSLCADLSGETGAGYVETAPAIAERVAAVVSAVPFAAGTVAAAAAARPIAVGVMVDDENMTAANVLDQLLGDVSLLWVLDDDEIVIRAWEWGASVASARSLGTVRRREAFKPVSKRKLGYRRNRHKMARDSLAAIVLASDVQFEDGASVEDLKPAEAGATHGALLGNGPDQPGTIFKIDGEDPEGGPLIVPVPREEIVTAEGTSADTSAVDGKPATDVRGDQELDLGAGFELARIVAQVSAIMQERTTLEGRPVKRQIRELRDTVGGNSASITEIMEVLADPVDGFARFLLRGEVDEGDGSTTVVGLEAFAGVGGISVLKFMASLVQFLHPDTLVPLIYFDTLRGLMVAEGVEVDRLKVNTAAIPVRASASTPIAGTGAGGGDPWTTLLSASIVLPVDGWVEATFVAAQSFASDNEDWAMELRIDGVTVYPVSSGLVAVTPTLADARLCSAGTIPVTVRWKGHSSITIRDRRLFIKAFPRTE